MPSPGLVATERTASEVEAEAAFNLLGDEVRQRSSTDRAAVLCEKQRP